MSGLSTQNAPSPSVVLPHYGFAALSFIVLTVLIFLSPNAFIGHYFSPQLLAVTHIAVLGWGSMIIFGAIYQLLPVILGTALFSENLARITFVFFATGIILLVFSFWNFDIDRPLQLASIFIFLSFLFFFVNVSVTAKRAKEWSTSADLIVTSALWLLLTGLIGLLMVFNLRYMILPKSHLVFLKIHAHIGIAGWFILLIMGVGSRLIPMFLLSPDVNKTKLSLAYYFINAALVAFAIDMYLTEGSRLLPLYALAACTGILFFISFVFEAYKKRLRKNLDIGMKHSLVAFFLIALPLVLSVLFSFGLNDLNPFTQQLYLLYGVCIFIGFITSLILGQTFKTLPFIVWLKIHQGSFVKENKLLPKDLYSEKIAAFQFWFYFPAIILFFAGILLSDLSIIRVGGFLLTVVAALYSINVFRLLFYSVDLKTPKLIDHGNI